MFFESFEGYKRVENEKKLTIEKIYGLLNNYIEEIGNLSLVLQEDENNIQIKINIDVKIKIYLQKDFIIIQRVIENQKNTGLGIDKNVIIAQADRLIEQIYDLLNDYMPDGIITEHITKAQKIYYMNQMESKKALGLIPVSNQFVITDENNQNILSASQNVLNHLYSIIDLSKKREEFALSYKDIKNAEKYTLIQPPFTKIDLYKNQQEVKTTYIGIIDNKDIKISADYTDNHYLIEVDEIVVGAVDCLDIDAKTHYRLEINDIQYTYLIIAVALISDIDNIIITNEIN